jgi:hypothetical protein
MFTNKQPENTVPFAPQGFDDTSKLVGETRRKFIADHLIELARFTRQLQLQG